MSRGPAPRSHAEVVDAWLATIGPSVTPEVLVRRLELALGALWARAEVTLGRVTVVAVVDRVLINASGRCAPLSALKIEPRRGVSCQALLSRVTGLERAPLLEGTRFLLVELLTLMGKLTAEILTPALHAALLADEVAAEAPGRTRDVPPASSAHAPSSPRPSRGPTSPPAGASGQIGQGAL